jgi:hypothetical protein
VRWGEKIGLKEELVWPLAKEASDLCTSGSSKETRWCADFRLVISHCEADCLVWEFKISRRLQPLVPRVTLMSLCSTRDIANCRYNAESFSQSSSLSDYNMMMRIKSGSRWTIKGGKRCLLWDIVACFSFTLSKFKPQRTVISWETAIARLPWRSCIFDHPLTPRYMALSDIRRTRYVRCWWLQILS